LGISILSFEKTKILIRGAAKLRVPSTGLWGLVNGDARASLCSSQGAPPRKMKTHPEVGLQRVQRSSAAEQRTSHPPEPQGESPRAPRRVLKVSTNLKIELDDGTSAPTGNLQ